MARRRLQGDNDPRPRITDCSRDAVTAQVNGNGWAQLGFERHLGELRRGECSRERLQNVAVGITRDHPIERREQACV
jgi:hypothetical protein